MLISLLAHLDNSLLSNISRLYLRSQAEMYPFESLNRNLFLYFNGKPGVPHWQITMATAIADYLILMIPLVLLALWLRGGRAWREAALRALCVTLLALLIGQLIGLLLPHPRPFMIGLGHTWTAHGPDASFPSDHATVFACVGLTLLLEGYVALASATLLAGLAVAWARIFLGVHFPFDMFGALGVAALALALVMPLWRKMGAFLTDWAERVHRWFFGRIIPFEAPGVEVK